MNKLLIALPILSLIIVSFVFFSLQETTVTYQDWQDCWSDHQDSNPCVHNNEFEETHQQFMTLTYGYGETHAIAECQPFRKNKDYIEISGIELNFNNYYAECFFSSQVQSVVNSNTCFKAHYYNPVFVKCAGF